MNTLVMICLMGHEIKPSSADSNVGTDFEIWGSEWTSDADRVEKVSPLISLFCFCATSLTGYWSPSRLISSLVTL